MSHTAWFFSVFVILFLAWIFTGGPLNNNQELPFINPPAPLGSGETYGIENSGLSDSPQTSEQGIGSGANEETDTIINSSPSSYKVEIRDISMGDSQNPNEEYVEIVASYNNTQPINISGWKLKSAITNRTVTIGKGSYLPYSGKLNIEQAISLAPGERAFILTGRSPIGSSFRLNTCTGYFEQFQDYIPPLPIQCPHPANENLPVGINGLKDECIEFIETLSRCKAYTISIPITFGDTCQEYVSRKITYASCVDMHKSDSDFYKPEWRIFLNRDQTLWKNKRETIRLLDGSGNVMDSISY